MRPSCKSIANFHKNYVAQVRGVNRDFVLLYSELSLFGGDKVAVDGSFFKPTASRGKHKDQRLREQEIVEHKEGDRGVSEGD